MEYQRLLSVEAVGLLRLGIRQRLEPTENVESSLDLASEIASHRAQHLGRPPTPFDVELVVAILCWWPLKPDVPAEYVRTARGHRQHLLYLLATDRSAIPDAVSPKVLLQDTDGLIDGLLNGDISLVSTWKTGTIVAEGREEPDVTEALSGEHREIERLYSLIEQAWDHDERAGLLREVVQALLSHAAVEEQLLYPKIRTVLLDGEHLAHEAEMEHQEIREMLASLGHSDLGETTTREVLGDVMSLFRRHVVEQEYELFPMLREAVEPEQLAEMAQELAQRRAHFRSPGRE